MRNELPETCLATLPGTGDLIVIKRGETGYYRSDWETGEKAKNQEIADLHNRKCGITPAQAQAMQIGSMFGFDVPGASPQIYFDEARYLWPLAAGDGMVMKDPMADRCCSIDGSIYQYQVAGEKCFYMEVSSVPESMMGVGRENCIILPDMVRGKPLVPIVTLNFDAETRTRTMGLESGSYSHGKEVNAGFEIIAKVQVGPVEYALGERGGKFPSFATWERTPANDGDGQPNYYWGHYIESRDEAVRDFCDRASEKYKMLTEYRKPSIKAQLAAKSVFNSQPAKPRDREAR